MFSTYVFPSFGIIVHFSSISWIQETYRTEKLSRTVHADSQYATFNSIIRLSVDIIPLSSDSSILPEDLATQSVRLKEEQLRREEEKVNAALPTLVLALADLPYF